MAFGVGHGLLCFRAALREDVVVEEEYLSISEPANNNGRAYPHHTEVTRWK